MKAINLLTPTPPKEPPNYTQSTHQDSYQVQLRRSLKRRPSCLRWGVCIFLLFISVLGGFSLVGLGLVIEGGLKVKHATALGETALQTTDFELASEALDQALLGLQGIDRGLPFFSYLKFLPWFGPRLTGVEAAVDASQDSLAVVLSGSELADEILSTVTRAGNVVQQANGSSEARAYSDLTTDEKRALLAQLVKSADDLKEMQVRLSLAQADLERLDDYDLLPSLQAALKPLRQLIPELQMSIDVLTPFATVAGELGGLNEDKQFLILYLNNDELRPAGGFIGVYGLAVVKDGEIKSLVTDDSYAVDSYVQGQAAYQVQPPAPLINWLGQPVWYFRDAAWSPSFAQSAKDATQLMRQEIAFGGQPVPEVHGAIGITPDFIASVLKYLGPITIEGQTFASDNIADQLEYQVEIAYAQAGTPAEQRKEIVSLLTRVMLDKLLALPPAAWPDVFKLMHAGFAEKQLALTSFNEGTQATLEDNDWAGVPNPARSDDVLMVVDANLAALKTDAVVNRQVDYSIRKVNNSYQATATITYRHTGSFDWKTTRYRTYTRVFVPLGSKLVSANGQLRNDKINNPDLLPGEVVTSDELGMTSFGAFISIEPGESRSLSFTYTLPDTVTAAVARGSYKLSAIKQMGAGDNLLTLDLDFGNNLLFAEPAETEADFGDNQYHLTTRLNVDKVFTVRFE